MKKIHCTFVFLLLVQLVTAQNFKVSTGIGLFDLIHIGGAYQFTDKNDLGIQIGTFPSTDDILAPTLEHRLYYRKSEKYANSNTWFFSQRLKYNYSRSDQYNWHSFFLCASIGRNYYLSEDYGFSWDAGVNFWLVDKQFENSTGLVVEDDSPPGIPGILPAIRIQFFRIF